MQQDWIISITHVLREANFCVDKFALLEEPRNELKVLLQNDFMGLAHEHAKLCSFPFPFGLVLISDIPKKKKNSFLTLSSYLTICLSIC